MRLPPSCAIAQAGKLDARVHIVRRLVDQMQVESVEAFIGNSTCTGCNTLASPCSALFGAPSASMTPQPAPARTSCNCHTMPPAHSRSFATPFGEDRGHHIGDDARDNSR